MSRKRPFPDFLPRTARPGATLVELIIVSAILVGLSGIVFVVLDAPSRLQGAVVSQEKVNADSITKALQLSMVDNFGLVESVKPLTPGEEKDICKQGVVDESCVNLDALVEGGYLATIPVSRDFEDDPLLTGYKVSRESAYLEVRPSVEYATNGTAGGGGFGGGGGNGGNGGDQGGGGTQDYALDSWSSFMPKIGSFNGYVTDTVTVNGTTYFGGRFTSLDMTTGSATVVDKESGASQLPLFTGKPVINVHSNMTHGSILPDGDGGWYLVGNFFSVTPFGGTEDATYDEIIHLTENGSFGSWKPSFDSDSPTANVFATAHDAARNHLYTVGSFADVNGETRGRGAAFDLGNNGTLLSWNPDIQGDGYTAVHAATIVGDTLFIGGMFTSVGGVARQNLAAFDLSGGSPVLLPWNPAPDLEVGALQADGTTLYVGGSFSTVHDGVNGGGSSVSRSQVAAFDVGNPGSISLTSWNPPLFEYGSVRALAVDASRLYVGGYFSVIGGQSRTKLAALDKTTAALDPWNPVLQSLGGSQYVNTLMLHEDDLYVGGYFLTSAGHSHAASFDMSAGGTLNAWNPNFNQSVTAFAADDTSIYAIGKFTGIVKPRTNLAAIDADGVLTNWNPGVTHGSQTALVTTVKTDGSRLFIGGNFETVAGQSRVSLASFDLPSGTLTGWNPGADAETAIELHEGNVYASGDFTTVAGQSGLGKLVRIDASTGVADASFTPQPDAKIQGIAFHGADIYVGGDFTSIGGQARSRIAKLDQTGAVQS